MLQKIIETFFTSGNQFLTGGFALMVLGGTVAYARSLPDKIWNLFLRHCTVVVDVNSRDQAYEWLIYMLDSSPYGKRTKRLTIRNVWRKKKQETLFIPNKSTHRFFMDGYLCFLTRSTPEPGGGGALSQAINSAFGGSNTQSVDFTPETLTLRVFTRKRKVVEDLVAVARDKFVVKEADCAIVYRWRWSAWERTRRARRPIESVFLPKDAENLVAEIKKFFDARAWYAKMGVPHRRGYLFYGPPGTGKSSAALAVAGALDVPIRVFNLANASDSILEDAVAKVDNEEPSILLLEDIDTIMKVQRETEEGEEKEESSKPDRVNLGTLLNCLDGLSASENIAVIMTTNYPDRLDPALIRKGRVDRRIEFGHATTSQIDAAIKRFLPNATAEQIAKVYALPKPYSMADVQEVLKQLCLGEYEEEGATPSPSKSRLELGIGALTWKTSQKIVPTVTTPQAAVTHGESAEKKLSAVATVEKSSTALTPTSKIQTTAPMPPIPSRRGIWNGTVPIH